MKINLWGLHIRISFSFVVLFTLIFINYKLADYLLWIPATLIHESGHLIMMIIFRNKPSEISVSAFDIRIISKNRYTNRLTEDILVVTAGPLLNILIFMIFFQIRKFSYVNLFIGLFNLLPSSSLDGGQLVYLILIRKFSVEASAKIVDILTIIISFPLFLLGCIILLETKFNFSLLFISVYLVLLIFFKKDKFL